MIIVAEGNNLLYSQVIILDNDSYVTISAIGFVP